MFATACVIDMKISSIKLFSSGYMAKDEVD